MINDFDTNLTPRDASLGVKAKRFFQQGKALDYLPRHIKEPQSTLLSSSGFTNRDKR